MSSYLEAEDAGEVQEITGGAGGKSSLLWQFSPEGACISVTVNFEAAAAVFPIHNRPLLLQELHVRILHWASDSFNHPLQLLAPLLTQRATAAPNHPPGDASATFRGSHVFFCGILPRPPLLAHDVSRAMCVKFTLLDDDERCCSALPPGIFSAFVDQVQLTLPSVAPELPLLGRVSNAKKEELLQTSQMLRTMGLIPRAEQPHPSQNPDDIAGLEWHLQCAAAANAPSAHAQTPQWKGLNLGNSQAIVIEAASRIASQHSQDTLRHRLMSSAAAAPATNHPPAQPPPHPTTGLKAQGSAAKANGKQQAEKAVLKAELASSGSVALLKSLKKDIAKLTQQLAEKGTSVNYGSSSLSVAHWLSRVRGGSTGAGMQLGFDVMQRLLLSPLGTLVPDVAKDPASMFQLGLTDEANPPPDLPLQAPDHTCFSRAFTFNAAPINGSIRSAIMQSTSLPYYYILSAQMQSCSRPSASRALWSTCSSAHAHNAPFIFSQLLSSLIPIMLGNRICNIVGPHGSGKTTLLQCYAKHVALSHAQQPGKFAWLNGVWFFDAHDVRSIDSLFSRLQWFVGCVVPSPRPASSFATSECGPKVSPQQPGWAEPGQHPCFTAYSHVVDAMLTLDVLFIFDGFESSPPAPAFAPSEDHYGLQSCLSTIGFVGAGDVAAVVAWLMQRNPKLSCIFASCAPLSGVPAVLLKMQPLDPDAQGQLFAEVVLPPDMAARRPTVAIEWKESCTRLSGCSPIPPLLQGFARGSTSLQVFHQSAAALSWLKFLTSQTITLSNSDSAHLNKLTGLRNYSVVISTPTLNPSEHLLSLKVQVNGSRYTSVPQAIALTPGSREHACVIAIDDALGSVKGITLSAAGVISRRLQPVHSVTLKHGIQQLICNFDAVICSTSPEISAPCQPLTSTSREETRDLAAFADDSQLYSKSVTGCSNAQLAAVANAIKRCAGHPHALPLLLLFVCAPAGLTWDELALVTEEQWWQEGSAAGRGGSKQGPDVSLKRAMSILCRAKEQGGGSQELPGLKAEKEALKKQALDSASQMGALRQLYEAGLLTVTCPSHVSHASDVHAPVM